MSTEATAPEWVRTYEKGADYIECLGGVSWNDAPLPYPWHHCRAQMRGWMGLSYVERCACGAIRGSAREPWQDWRAGRRSGNP